ncbi:SDH family Clp fold serine proteinase [Mesorhizobium erdmanii]|uniref:SDH family Clp fold serine proteinase n=1 Tax=Mesorhizobium erdmanii TaxID=1777866 RepID=UPI0013783D47|nr:hypothetical protein [Mesorhizobium erdmanii]
MEELNNSILSNLARRLSEEEEADIYSLRGPIIGDCLRQLEVASASPTHSRAILVLSTEGGDGATAYRIARHFHRHYGELTVYIPHHCWSAGTFVALGAHNLIIDSNAVMGPIDPQFRKHDEVCINESALAPQAAVRALGEAAFNVIEKTVCNLAVESEGTVSFKLGSQVGADLAASLLSPLVAKLDPTIFGNRHLAIETAIEYGNRLVRASGNASEETVHRLVTGYPSHNFAIDFTEVAELFGDVSKPSELLTLYGKSHVLDMDLADYGWCPVDPEAAHTDAENITGEDELTENRRAA